MSVQGEDDGLEEPRGVRKQCAEGLLLHFAKDRPLGPEGDKLLPHIRQRWPGAMCSAGGEGLGSRARREGPVEATGRDGGLSLWEAGQ